MSEGLRDKNRAEVRGRLVAAALELFAAEGFDAVTIDAIAARADVSRRTFFRYFPTKEDVVVARRLEQLERFRALLAAPAAGASPFASVRAAFEALASDYRSMRKRVLTEHALFCAAPSLLQRDLEIDRAFEQEIAAALGRGAESATAKHRARLCAACIMGVLRVVIEDWAQGRGRSDLAVLGAEALDLVEPLARGDQPVAGRRSRAPTGGRTPA